MIPVRVREAGSVSGAGIEVDLRDAALPADADQA